MSRVANFTAGPAALPLPVLEEAQRELLDYQGTGMSIMENSHRSKTYEVVHNEAIALTKELLGVPDGYQTLFIQGGASQQFAMIPLNLLPAGKSADYLITGHWSERAIEEAQLLGKARIAGTGKATGFMRIPTAGELELDPQAAYVHLTTNNTIYGTEWASEPEVGNVPLIADMSSDFLSRRIDVKKYGMIYAGAQKNIGPSGVLVGIVRQDLIDGARKDIPSIFRYATFAKNNSLFNTPPTFAIYLVRGVLRWVKGQGGLEKIEATNVDKAEAPVRRDRRCGRLLQEPGRQGQPLAHERRLALAVGAARREVRERRGKGGTGGPEGASLGRRHSRVDLQRRLRCRRAEAVRLHVRVSSDKPSLKSEAKHDRNC